MTAKLSVEARINRLAIHERDWLNAHYDAEVSAKVAKAIGDKQLLEQAAKRLGDVIKALDVLQAEAVALKEEQCSQTEVSS